MEMDGFVKIMPNKGLYVTDILLTNIIRLFQTRMKIEPITLRMAAPHLPEEELLAFCHNSLVLSNLLFSITQNSAIINSTITYHQPQQ